MNKQEFDDAVGSLNLQISEHAMTRYKERVANNQINNLDLETRTRYTEELKKLFLSSELMYSGNIGHSSGEVDVYLNRNGWVILTGKNQKQVITLYKVDLNIDDAEINQAYITKSMAKIRQISEDNKTIAASVDSNKSSYQKEINSINSSIKDLRKQLELLNARNEALQDLLKTEDARNYQGKINLRNALENYMVKDKLQIES